jgi:hypothetical protein
MNIDALKDVLFQFAADGWYLFPVGRDKKPLTDHGFKDATQTQMGILRYIKQYPNCNWAGYFSGQLIIDVDVKKFNGFISLDQLESKYGNLPKTRKHRTGSGGMHIIFKQPSGYDVHNTVKMAGYEGIDRRGNGGYIVLPPSQNETGGVYTVLDDSLIVDAPKWLLELQSSSQPERHYENAGDPVPQGEQDIWLFSRARSYRGWGDTEDIILEKLKLDVLRCKDQNPANPYTDKDLDRIARSASRYSVNEFRLISDPTTNQPIGTTEIEGFKWE